MCSLGNKCELYEIKNGKFGHKICKPDEVFDRWWSVNKGGDIDFSRNGIVWDVYVYSWIIVKSFGEIKTMKVWVMIQKQCLVSGDFWSELIGKCSVK